MHDHLRNWEFVIFIGAPENYLLSCYIGLGYPADEKVEVEQVQYKAEDKIHFGKLR